MIRFLTCTYSGSHILLVQSKLSVNLVQSRHNHLLIDMQLVFAMIKLGSSARLLEIILKKDNTRTITVKLW